MRLRHVGLDTLQALAKKGVLEGALTCNLEFSEQCVLKKKKKVKFCIVIHRLEGLLDGVHINVWGPTKSPSLGLSLLLMIHLDIVGYTL